MDKIEEREALEEISRATFEKLHSKYRTELSEIESQLSNANKTLSNLDRFIDFSVEMSSNLPFLWQKSPLQQKRQLQKVIFPGGIFFNKEKNTYRTSSVNQFFVLMSSFSAEKIANKKGQTGEKADLSRLVAQKGDSLNTF